MKTSTLARILAAASFAVAGIASAQNLLDNPGFETGDFSGWTRSGNSGFTSIITSPVNSGSYAASFGPIGSEGYISQILVTNPVRLHHFPD